MSWISILEQRAHHRTHGPQTYVRRLWLIVLVNLGYSFNVQCLIAPLSGYQSAL